MNADTHRTKQSRWIFLLPGTLLVLHALRYDFISDDTFIGLRYVRNLIDGQGLVFNVGERVEGFTNLLWLLVIAPFGLAGADLLVAARALGLLCALGLLVAVTLLARRAIEGPAWLVAIPAAIVALNAPVACWALTGMETPFFALFVALSVLLVIRGGRDPGKALAAGAALGLTALIRPEGLIVGLALCATLLIRPPKRDWKPIVITVVSFLAVVAIHLLWRRWYYGDWLPNTYHAKVGGWSFAMWMRGWSYLFGYAKDLGGIVLFFLPFAAAAWRRDRFWWTVAGAALALTGGVLHVGGDGLPMYRFIVPVIPLWSILVLTLLVDAHHWAKPRVEEKLRPPLLAAAGLTGIGLALLGFFPDPLEAPYHVYQFQRTYEVPTWTMVGKWLKEKARPGDSVACVPIGAIGYYSELPLYDMLGLTDRHIARREQALGRGLAGHEKHDGPYILSREPTFLLLGNVRVTDEPMDPADPQFVRVHNQQIEDREYDIYTPELARDYVPQFARLPDGRYFNFVYRKESWLDRTRGQGGP